MRASQFQKATPASFETRRWISRTRAKAGGAYQRSSPGSRAEMQAYRPDLILLAFGTNEGFERDFDEAEYAGSYLEALNLLRAVAPGAAILAMGPPDAAMTRPDLYYDGVDQPLEP